METQTNRQRGTTVAVVPETPETPSRSLSPVRIKRRRQALVPGGIEYHLAVLAAEQFRTEQGRQACSSPTKRLRKQEPGFWTMAEDMNAVAPLRKNRRNALAPGSVTALLVEDLRSQFIMDKRGSDAKNPASDDDDNESMDSLDSNDENKLSEVVELCGEMAKMESDAKDRGRMAKGDFEDKKADSKGAKDTYGMK